MAVVRLTAAACTPCTKLAVGQQGIWYAYGLRPSFVQRMQHFCMPLRQWQSALVYYTKLLDLYEHGIITMLVLVVFASDGAERDICENITC